MLLCGKCFSSFSSYVLPLNFFFEELGFATVSGLPAFTVWALILSLICLFSLSACLNPLLLSLIYLLSPCACLNSLWSACFHCLSVLLLSDVSGFTATATVSYSLSLSDFRIMSIRQGWVGFKHFFFSMNNANKIQKRRLNLVLLLLPWVYICMYELW
jgi:hypothetical protein